MLKDRGERTALGRFVHCRNLGYVEVRRPRHYLLGPGASVGSVDAVKALLEIGDNLPALRELNVKVDADPYYQRWTGYVAMRGPWVDELYVLCARRACDLFVNDQKCVNDGRSR